MPTVRTTGTRLRRGRRGAGALFALLLAGSLAVAGCSSSGGSDSSSASADKAAPARPGGGRAQADSPSGATGDDAAPGGRPTTGARTPAPATYLVRTAHMTVRTPHVEDALNKARDLAAAAGGYAADEDTSVDARGHTRSSVQLRVPAAGYDRLLTDLAGLGTLLERRVSVADVTGEVVDVESRIKSQQASVARVRALMDRAARLSDVVSLESELSTREAALESLEAQQATLRSQTDLATVTLRLTEPPVRFVPPKPAAHDGFWTAVGHALEDGWHAFYLALRGTLVVLSVTLPFLLAGLLAWFAYRPVRRLLPRRRPARTVAHASLHAPDGRPWQVPAPASHGEEPEQPRD
ncbi:DUF4349 domain-containing protein [Streptomyces sp.]|uniref:DUF4349 domain-containing protein n=1 Tax=Streptomyces sp. TaxID=1931 RepID=UPI002F3FED12